MQSFNLICEYVSHRATSVYETKGDDKELYIEGIFAQAEVWNGNERWYPLGVVQEAVDRYVDEKVKPGIAWGELDHPDRPDPKMQYASHRIVSLFRDGKSNNFIGKAVILDAGQGLIVRSAIRTGGTIAVSTRGLAEVVQEGSRSVIQSPYYLCAVDVVANPSAPNAFVKGILEGKQFVCEGGIFICKEIDQMRKVIKSSKNPLNEELILKNFKKHTDRLARG